MGVEITHVKRTGPSRERVTFSDGSILYRIKAEKGFVWRHRASGTELDTIVTKTCGVLYKKFMAGTLNNG